MFVQKHKYKTSMRKISSIQSKIEGWDVRKCDVSMTPTISPSQLVHVSESGP